MMLIVHVKLTPGLSRPRQHSIRKRDFFTRKLGLNLEKKLLRCYVWSMTFYGAGTRTLRKADQKYLESSEMC
jgi:hypothetical protein